MIRRRYPFFTPDPNNPEFLVGHYRKRLYEQLTTTLEYSIRAKTTSLLLTLGPYGSGKTHLLQWFIKKSKKEIPKLIQIYVEAPRELDFSSIANRLLNEVRTSLPDVMIKPKEEEPVERIAQIIRKLSKMGYGFCLVIDEFENAWTDVDFVYKIRELIDISPPGLLIILSAAAAEFEISRISGPLQARANQIFFLEPFNEEDASMLIKECASGEVRFSESAIRLINSVADGVPRKIIGLAHATVAFLEIEGGYTVGTKEVKKTLSNEQIYRHFRSSQLLVLRQKIVPYLLFFDVALISLVAFYLIFIVDQLFPVVMIICFLLVLVLYPIERLILELYGARGGRDSVF